MASIVANLVNFGLDFFLIFGPPKMGVAGAALATSVRQDRSSHSLGAGGDINGAARDLLQICVEIPFTFCVRLSFAIDRSAGRSSNTYWVAVHSCAA